MRVESTTFARRLPPGEELPRVLERLSEEWPYVARYPSARGLMVALMDNLAETLWRIDPEAVCHHAICPRCVELISRESNKAVAVADACHLDYVPPRDEEFDTGVRAWGGGFMCDKGHEFPDDAREENE